MASCQKDQDKINPSVPSTQVDMGTPDPGDSGNVQLNTGSPKAAMTGYSVTPRFGKPNSTYYLFKVMDVTGTLALSVKLYDRASGSITYLPMAKVGSYWTLSTKLSNNGWFDYNYVYSANKVAINSSAIYTGLCNSKNMFNSSPFAIVWPFGADGSSWTNRLAWIGANEPGGCGSGPGQGGHYNQGCQADDSYAVDWNKNCSSSYADDGSVVRSPLDGKVLKVYIDSPSNHNGGYGNAVDIEQETASGTKFVFRIAHLKYTPSVVKDQYVRAGVTAIGNIGMTGGTSTAPHGHCVLYNNNGSCKIGVGFTFSAQ
ncbi:MAG: peptidoglycan DD-metalloendopeptidase family protein [candidate division SR1 bacterium]|nr:peptidoglycan DD-metalloendopeptidase family protein [candidate division SR1 bacterium]